MQRRFEAVLERIQISLPGIVVWLPFDPVEAWPNRVKLRVRGTIRAADATSEAVPFATTLIRSKERGYFMLVTGRLRQATRLSAGSRVEVVLEPDVDERAAVPPPELAKLLKADRSLKKWFEALNYSTRKYLGDEVRAPKSPEARVRRAELWVERMMLTMDGEESPPPILQIAFRRQPLARAGWQAMTANQRRLALFAIFICQSPEAQAKRVERVVADALKAARRAKPPDASAGS
jgi:uncharacterized protein YdeI (YjbR/CyaY-like superfamily)